jgi:hypothetical protein
MKGNFHTSAGKPSEFFAEKGRKIFFQNVGNYQQLYPASYPRLE